MKFSPAPATLLAVMLFASSAAAQDAATGKVLFQDKCAVCHSLIPGHKSVGPSLLGVFGKKAGTNDSTYPYSIAMTNSNQIWNEAGLNAYLTNPRDVVKGTKMLFPGIADAKERADVIAYIKTLN